MRKLLFLNIIILFLCPVIQAEEIYYPGTKFISVAADVIETNLIWFGTNKCLLKYNRSSDKWDIISKDVKDIRVIAINPLEKDFIWLGTVQGVKKYSRAKNTVEKIKDKDGILDIQINAILFDKIIKKYIWFASDFGLVRFDTETGEWKTYASKEGLTAKKVNSIAEDPGGDNYSLWVGTDNGLFKYSSQRDFLVKVNPPEDFIEIKGINAVAVDESYVLIGSANYGLVVYHKEKNSWQLYARKVNGENANDCILSIMPDLFEPSSIWFGTRLHGVIRFDKINNIWQDFSQDNIIAASLSIDVDNNIWSAASICSGGGAFKYLKNENKWLYTDPLIVIEDKFDLTWRKY
ncbi:MAG: hypothetical protein PHX78_10405 [bacterium]|nr:hypothetical protein [bacterium]